MFLGNKAKVRKMTHRTLLAMMRSTYPELLPVFFWRTLYINKLGPSLRVFFCAYSWASRSRGFAGLSIGSRCALPGLCMRSCFALICLQSRCVLLGLRKVWLLYWKEILGDQKWNRSVLGLQITRINVPWFKGLIYQISSQLEQAIIS
jgi:hypothetical protein